MSVEDIVKKRAMEDCRCDIENDQLWGEDEISGCVDEIQRKITSALTFASHMKFSDVSFEREIDSTLLHNDVMRKAVILWQDTYRIEKMFYIMHKRLFNQVGDDNE